MLLTATAETAIETLAEVTGNENLKPGVIQNYLKDLPDKAFALLVKVVFAIIVIVIMWQAIKAITNLVEKSLKKTKIEDATAKFLASVVKVSLEVFLAFSIAAGFGMDTASIVALLGSAGVAIGLAVQGTLSDFAGGILILLAKPFRVGDYIVVNGAGIEGSVTEIALINTMRILDTMVGISYSADIDKARAVATRVLDANEFISDKYEKVVYVDELADSSVNLRIRGWVKPADYVKAKWSMNEAIKKAFDKEGVEIPFPQMDVHMR